jgi:hypothetical protein
MKLSTLDAAIAEAERFISTAREYKHAEEMKKESYYRNPRESGATRRASLDLTRKLADLRLGR